MKTLVSKVLNKTNTTAIAIYSLFASSAWANDAEKMLEEPTSKLEDLGAAIGDVGPIVAILAICIVAIGMQFNFIAKKWAINIAVGATVLGIASLIADFIYG